MPEYGKSLEESEIQENAFQIIFAFDEIVALGYRESVNLAQINTFIQMDSHEEKVAIALREVSLVVWSFCIYIYMYASYWLVNLLSKELIDC